MFQSTLPREGATLLESGLKSHEIGFNPRSPVRERPSPLVNIIAHWAFQSTLPREGATMNNCGIFRYIASFNPRSPVRERQGLNLMLHH